MGLNVKHVELKAPAGALGGAWTAALGCAPPGHRDPRGRGRWVRAGTCRLGARGHGAEARVDLVLGLRSGREEPRM